MNVKNPEFQRAFQEHYFNPDRSTPKGFVTFVTLNFFEAPYNIFRGKADFLPTSVFSDSDGNIYATGQIYKQQDNVVRLDFNKQTFEIIYKLGSAKFSTVGDTLHKLLFYTPLGSQFTYAGKTFTNLAYDPDVWDGSTFFAEEEAANKHDLVEPFEIQIVHKRHGSDLCLCTQTVYGMFRDGDGNLLLQLYHPTKRSPQKHDRLLANLLRQQNGSWETFGGLRSSQTDCEAKKVRLLDLGVTGVHVSYGTDKKLYILTSEEIQQWKDDQGPGPITLFVGTTPEVWETFKSLYPLDPLKDTYLRSYNVARRTGNVEKARESLLQYQQKIAEHMMYISMAVEDMDYNESQEREADPVVEGGSRTN